MLITNNDARKLPNLQIDSKGATLKFDRILCDVPCSGDGTFRKNLTLWKNFNSHQGHAIHPLQIEILEKAFSLLKKGGRLVYSTCTFNTQENEENIAWLLNELQAEIVPIETTHFKKGRNDIGNYALPSLVDTEGFFICVLQKQGTRNQLKLKLNKKSVNFMKNFLN